LSRHWQIIVAAMLLGMSVLLWCWSLPTKKIAHRVLVVCCQWLLYENIWDYKCKETVYECVNVFGCSAVSNILWNKGKVNLYTNLFHLRKVLIYMASLSPLPKENLLHCDIMGSLDVFTCWFLCFLCSLCVLLVCCQILMIIKLCVSAGIVESIRSHGGVFVWKSNDGTATWDHVVPRRVTKPLLLLSVSLIDVRRLRCA